jgi:hypothetical protein
MRKRLLLQFHQGWYGWRCGLSTNDPNVIETIQDFVVIAKGIETL